MSILDYDATTLAQKIKSLEISSLEATEAYINHLQKINPTINCLIEERFAEARKEAVQCDEALKNGNAKGRLFGVPISMKEAFDVAEMRTTGGLIHRKDEIAVQDAEIVARLKNEGAIILGKTNTPTLCFCQETNNKLYGRTNNPWDPTRTVGGSSGGEGALMAAGGAAVGVGSDIGGSIRFPAHFNGVIGFKSGANQVSDDGSYPPITIELQDRMLGIGAMAKSVRDARFINEILAYDIPPSRNIAEFTITIPNTQIKYPISNQTQTLLDAVQTELSQNFSVNDEQPPMYEDTALLWQLVMSIDGAKGVADIAFHNHKTNRVKEWLKELLFKNSNWHRHLTWALIGAYTFKPSPAKLVQLKEEIQKGDQLVQNYLHNRLLILPVYHTPALPHGEVYKEIFSIRKTYQIYMPFVAYPNTWGLPSLTIPIGEEEGLPIGFQIISNVGNEDAIFQLGEMLEKKFRGWKRAM